VIFNSLEFAAFFAAVVGLYWLLPHRAQNRFLLVASYFFYGWWDWRFLGLLAFSTAVDYLVGRGVRDPDGQHRKTLLVVSLVANLGILAVFKYFGFFAASLNDSLSSVGLEALAPTVSFLLPVGISFYTFQSMSYTIDCYRGRLEPVDDPLDFALYVSFFPQLVAGPIERATRLVPQIIRPRSRPSFDAVASGASLIAIGLLKKVVVADMAARTVDATFARSGDAGGLELLVATYAFALQIYGDFSGYSDIARGTARLLGFELMENFDRPYLSRSITEFWRRWHISLSTWLRDYLYIPLGGNRRGPRRTYLNLALTMLLGGLWHGPAWTFVIWGGLHGGLLAAERALGLGTSVDASPRKVFSPIGLTRMLVTFNLVCLAWIFFRAETLTQAVDIVAAIVTLRAGPLPMVDILNTLLFLGGIALFVDLCQYFSQDEVGIRRLHPLVQGAFYGGVVALTLLMSGGEPVPFVYFQF
jgi:D-alanyl-lipoteichoic acid acyltransferase DltB (MBOAT superfamily)